MITALAVVGLLGGTLVVLGLAFVPAVSELARKKGTEPLFVDQNYEGDVRHFARSFGNFVQAKLGAAIREAKETGLPSSGNLPDQSPYLILTGGQTDWITPEENHNHSVDRVLVLLTKLALPEEMVFTKEVFSECPLSGGSESVYRAILSRSNISLGKNSTVLRWVHANGRLEAEPGCRLLGRASADSAIRLAPGCSFTRLNAPSVEFGPPRGPAETAVPAFPANGNGGPEDPGVAKKRWLVHGNLELPPDSVYEGNLVVRGWIRIGAGSRIAGSIKAHKGLHVERDTRIDGSIVSATSISIASDCLVRGPVIAQDDITIEAGAFIGGPELPTTVTAPRISIQPGVVAFGSVWASEHGSVGQPQGGSNA